LSAVYSTIQQDELNDMKSKIIAFSRLWINGFVYILLLALNDVNAANFSIQDQEVPGDALTVTVPIKVSDFSDVGAMQFTLSWDSAVLSFKSLGDFDHSTLPTELFFFGETHFSLNAVSNGNLLCLYEQPLAADVVLDGNATIFSITFDLVGGDGSSSHVQFSDEPTPRKLASFFAQSPEFISQNGTIQIGKGSNSSGDSTAAFVPHLSFARDGANGFILSWEGDALLHTSRDLSGGFEPVPDAYSPYRVDALGHAFFKLGLKP
jgi:hypothetical protein